MLWFIIRVSGFAKIFDESLSMRGGIPSIPMAFLASNSLSNLRTSSSVTGLNLSVLKYDLLLFMHLILGWFLNCLIIVSIMMSQFVPEGSVSAILVGELHSCN